MNDLKLLDIYYGGRCNLTCFQCDTRSDMFRKGEFDPTLDNITQGINLAKNHFTIKNLSLLGGEPFLNLEKVIDILKYIRSIDDTCVITLPSNGSLLEKYLDQAHDLIENYNLVLSISNHYAAFDSNKTKKIKDAVTTLVSRACLEKRDSEDYYLEVFNYKDTKEDWQQRLSLFENTTYSSPGDTFWGTKYKGIFYHEQIFFQQHYQIVDGKIKPHGENQPDKSYQNGCCSPFCTFLYDKKLYKCAALGTLKKFLQHNNLLNDNDWQKYLAYSPLDLENCSAEQIKEFSGSKYRSIEQCDMCSSIGRSYRKTAEKTLPKYKNYVSIKRLDR